MGVRAPISRLPSMARGEEMKRAASRLTATALVFAMSMLLAIGPNLSSAPAATVSSSSVTGSAWIRSKFPLQAAATQNSTQPATRYWALLIGLNDYASPTVDNVGARQD